MHLDTGKKRDILKHTHKKGVKSGDSRNDQARPSAVALRAMAGQVGSGATSRPSGVRSRRWITPGYDPGRDSLFFFFLFFIFYPAPLAFWQKEKFFGKKGIYFHNIFTTALYKLYFMRYVIKMK